MTSLSQPLQAVVTLFEGPLAGVRFGDVDAAGLSRLAAEVTSAAAELEQQEARLVELRQGLAQRQEALLVLAQQALAYARIYAEGDETLSAQLNDIVLPRAGKPRKQAAGKTAAVTGEGSETPGEGTAAASTRPSSPGENALPVAGAAQGDRGSADDATAEEPLKTKPSYARPKVKRRLGRAATQGDSV